ncbi:hypothetical protein SOVF_204960 [Spinacia oleracea]|nr:hypothetical protein SOVF_204960 [Spinacia oleracea]
MPSNYFVTQLFFGTGQFSSPYVILDSGDDKTWIQCDGCNPCFEVKGGNIRPNASVSYKLLSVDDPRCNPKFLYHWACGYSREYGRRATSIGLMGTDTFRFTNPKTQKPEDYLGLAFGCGLANTNFNFGLNKGPQNLIAGIMGLVPGPQSFLTQLDGVTQGRFSYCLTSWAETNPGISTIYFGASAQAGPRAQQIHMNPSTHYYLFLRGIVVNGRRLLFDKSICAKQYRVPQTTLTGFIIDSGAPYTLLPTTVYQELKSAVIDFFARYGWRRTKELNFDLCYTKGPRVSQDFPTIIFEFTGPAGRTTEWVMDRTNMFVTYNNDGGFCMVVEELPDPGPCIFGAYQQANFRILYDAKNWMLKFEPVRCQENFK